MPSLNQDFTRFERDEFILRFTVTDAVTTLGNSSYTAWWGLSNTDEADGGVQISGHTTTNEYSSLTGYDISVNASGCSTNTGMSTLSYDTPEDVTVKVYDYYVEVTINLDNLTGVTDGTYYHELVLMPIVGTTAYQCRSTVAATGILTVKDSQYTNYSYR